MKHTLSPFSEYALVLMAAAYGVLAMYFASVQPLVVATTADIRSLAPPVSLDTDAWTRYENAARGYQFALPSEWSVDADDSDRVTALTAPALFRGWTDPRGFEIDVLELGEREEAQNVAAREFEGRQPALYDVSVYGKPALFVIDFERGKVVRQVVYVPIGSALYVFRGGSVEPAVFASFISSVKFFPELMREPDSN